MAQVAVLSVTVAANASDQIAAHGLARTPTIIAIVEPDEDGIKTGMVNRCYVPAGAIIGTTKTTVKSVTAVNYTVANSLYAKAATDDLWVLTGFSCTNLLYNKCLLCLNTSGTMTIAAGTEAATAAAVVLPETPANSCVIAILQVHPTGTGDFTGGTHDLDDGTVVPNATYTDVGGHPDNFPKITQGAAADATNIHLDNSMSRARNVYVFCMTPHSIIA